MYLIKFLIRPLNFLNFIYIYCGENLVSSDNEISKKYYLFSEIQKKTFVFNCKKRKFIQINFYKEAVLLE